MFKPILNLMLLFCFIAGMVLLGCNNPQIPVPPEPDNVSSNKLPKPDGEIDVLPHPPQGTDGKIYARGVGNSPSERVSVKLAKQEARVELAEQRRIYVSALTKDFVEQVAPSAKAQLSAVFSQVSESFVDEKLVGVRQEKLKTTPMSNGTYRSQVILSLTQTTVDSTVEQTVSKDDALYQEFKSTRAHAELQARKEAERQRNQ